MKLIIHGCNGRMGRYITELASADSEIEIVAGIDPFNGIDNKYPVFSSIKECDIDADVIIDFAQATAVDGLIDYVLDKKIPVVLCTTGLSDEQTERVKKASQVVPVLKSANMSLGINLLLKLIKDATKTLADEGFDIEIVEKHHRMKKDAPSGTALALADSVNEAADNRYTYVYDRSERTEKRPDNEIGISSVRGGTIVGDHDVIFAGEDEVITISHSAYSRAVFAKGAITAAKFLTDAAPGFYNMQDVIG